VLTKLENRDLEMETCIEVNLGIQLKGKFWLTTSGEGTEAGLLTGEVVAGGS
jgi:hypothetical protein